MKTVPAIARRVAVWGTVAIAVVAPTQYGIRILDRATLSVADPLVWLAFAAWLVYCFGERPAAESEPAGSLWRARWRAISPPLLHALLVAAAALSVPRAGDRLLAAKDLFQWIEYLLMAFVLFSGVCGLLVPRRRIAWLLLGMAAAVVGLGLVHYWTPSVPDFGVRATFGNRNVFGGYLAMMLPLAFGLLLYDPHRLRRAGYGLLIVAGASVLLAGGSFLAIALAFAALALTRGTRTFLVLLAVALLAAGAVRPLLPRDNAEILHRSVMLCEPDDESMMHERYAEWQAALFMIGDQPWRGVGLGNYQRNIGLWFGSLPDKAEPAEPDSQNLYLVVGSTIGLPGALCLVALLIQAMIGALKSFSQAHDPVERGIALGAFGAMLGFAVNSFWSPLLVRGIGLPLMLVLALAGGRGRPK